jgi:hypothetical protein
MLPSKKILIMFAVLIVGIGALTWYGYGRAHEADYSAAPNQNQLDIAATSSADITTSKIDTDNDGLPDWEEALYGTDPRNPDTDSDGTPDGKEVELGRNPLVKGPKDALASKDNPSATSTAPENLTLTDTFARDFFTQFMSLQQSGTKITADNANQIASDYLKNKTLPNISARQYSAADLSLTDSDPTHLANYRDAITAVFGKYWPSGNTNELYIMQQAFTNSDTNALTGLSTIISAYQNTLSNTLALSVPKLAVSLHLNVINSLSTYIETLKMIQSAYTDPLSGLVGLNAYQNNQANVWVSLTNLRVYFINSLQ